MRNYAQAYTDLFEQGHLGEEVIQDHIKKHEVIDRYLPNPASFFYIIELPGGRYRFLGKQHETVSGYPVDLFMEKGIEMFIHCLHPQEIPLIVDQVYPDFLKAALSQPLENRKNLQYQYNFRFRTKSGEYINLLEQTYILEHDEDGRPTLLLGHIISIDNTQVLPLRASCRVYRENNVSELLYAKTYSDKNDDQEPVTRRELDILQNLARGKSSREIGQELHISPHTVDTHRRNLLRKLGCRSVVELAQYAFRNGIL